MKRERPPRRKHVYFDVLEKGWRREHLELVEWWDETRMYSGPFGSGTAMKKLEVKLRWRCDCGREFEEWNLICADAVRRGGFIDCGVGCALPRERKKEKPAKENVKKIQREHRPAGKIVLYMYDDVRAAVTATAEGRGMSVSAWLTEAALEKLFGSVGEEDQEGRIPGQDDL